MRDNADNCPKVAGSGADGCPPATVVVNNVRRASKTTVKVSETKTGPVVIKAKGKVKLKGTGVKAGRVTARTVSCRCWSRSAGSPSPTRS